MRSIKTPLSLGNPPPPLPPYNFLSRDFFVNRLIIGYSTPHQMDLSCSVHLSYAINYRERPALQKPV